MVVIVDYGMGNLRSVAKAFQRIGATVSISSQINNIQKAERIVLPGVGHFKKGIENLEAGLMRNSILQKVEEGTPCLGICLGMQLLTRCSEEGHQNGLGIFDAETKKFMLNRSEGYKVPHMGWNNIVVQKKSILFDGLTGDEEFYFVHSYYVKCLAEQQILAKTKYGIEFISALEKDNIFAVQFHPEKSHDAGLHILSNFMKI